MDRYKRVLLKISGEALAKESPILEELKAIRNLSRMEAQGIHTLTMLNNLIEVYKNERFSIDLEFVNKLTSKIAECQNKYKIKFGIVPGGGNFWRGAQHGEIERDYSDQMGMLATVINSRALHSSFESIGVESRVLTRHNMAYYGETFNYGRLKKHFDEERIIIFAEGTGNPYSTTDTGALTAALEMKADAVFKLTDVDGYYCSDPNKNPNAKLYSEITYDDAVRLKAMDGTAIELARANNMPIRLFNINPIENLDKALFDEIGTLVCPKVKTLKFAENK